MLTDEMLAELERLDRDATPGPWRHVSDYLTQVWGPVPGDSTGSMQIARVGMAHFDLANADFVAAARNALPELVAEVRALRERNEVLLGEADRLKHELALSENKRTAWRSCLHCGGTRAEGDYWEEHCPSCREVTP